MLARKFFLRNTNLIFIFVNFFLDIACRTVSYHDENLDGLLQPKLVTPLPLQMSNKAGAEVRLLCLLTGYPPLEINWFLNGEPLHQTGDGRISFDNQMRMLVIKDLQARDGGSITFQARNKYGEVSSNCYMEVISKKDLHKTGSHSPKPIRRLMHAMKRMKSF